MRRKNQFRPQMEKLEARAVMSATVFEHNNIGYFVDNDTASLNRYDINNEQWLSPITLVNATEVPTVAHADNDGIYVAFGKSVYRYSADGATRTHLLNTQTDVLALHTDGNLLFINQSTGPYVRFVSIDKTSNTIIDTAEDYTNAVVGSSIAPQVNRIFGRSVGVSPSDITTIAYRDNGEFVGGGSSSYHGEYPNGSYTWVFPGDGKVTDNSGTVYNTANLTQTNSFATPITDLDFTDSNLPIVLSGNKLVSYSNAILPTGEHVLTSVAKEIFVNDENVITFSTDATSATGYRVDIVPLSELDEPEPGAPVNPVGLVYTPDRVVQANDGTVLLFSSKNKSIFRWDPESQTYQETIPLLGEAAGMAYSSATDTIYLSYNSGQIRQIQLGEETLREVPFVSLSTGTSAIAAAGPYLYVLRGFAQSTGRESMTFAADGTQVEQRRSGEFSKDYVWSEVNQRLYFFRDGTSPNDLHSLEINANGTAYANEPPGGMGVQKESPLHGGGGFVHPIRPSPDGRVVVLGSGVMYDAITLDQSPYALANSITDAAWLGNKLFTVRNISGVVQYQHWTAPTYGLENVVQTSGTAHRLMAVGENQLLSIRLIEGRPVFTILNENLEVIPSIPPVVLSNDDVAENLPAGTVVGTFSRTGAPEGATFTYELVAGEGDADNASFTIDGDQLRTAATFDAETKSSYSIRVKSTDGEGNTLEQTLVVHVQNVNEPVLDVALADSQVAENQEIGTVVGTFNSVDTDLVDTYTYVLVDGPGDAHNHLFSIVGDELRTEAKFNFEARSSYSVRVRTTDGFGYTAERAFVITITDANDAPTLNASLEVTLPTIREDSRNPGGKLVGGFVAGQDDADRVKPRGIVVTGLSHTTQGTWQFSLDQGETWTDFGPTHSGAARMLASDRNTKVRFVPAPDFHGTVRMTFRAWDRSSGASGGVVDLTGAGKVGGSTAFSAQSDYATLTITPVNDPPRVTMIGGTGGYRLNAAAVLLAPRAEIIDVDSSNFATGSLRVSIASGAEGSERIEIGGPFTRNGRQILLDGEIIGVMNAGGGVGATELAITFNYRATPAVVQQLVRSLAFRTEAGTSLEPRVINFVLTDGDGGSVTRSKSVNVTA